MTTAIIVQARVGSTRLPGKVMKVVAGKTFLARMLERCRAIKGADVVCCAVPASVENDVVAEEAERCAVVVFRGADDDVLDRYYHAALYLGADVIMRLTSDCPLIDPALCDEVLLARAENHADYASNNNPPTLPHGLDAEVLTFAWLERAHREAKKSSDREHVTQYIRNHAEASKINVRGPGCGVEEHRWTLDTPADLAFFEALIPLLPADPSGWSWQVPLSIVEGRDDLKALNAGQDRYTGLKKSLATDASTERREGS